LQIAGSSRFQAASRSHDINHQSIHLSNSYLTISRAFALLTKKKEEQLLPCGCGSSSGVLITTVAVNILLLELMEFLWTGRQTAPGIHIFWKWNKEATDK
jgi:hypothetical protein